MKFQSVSKVVLDENELHVTILYLYKYMYSVLL